MFLHAARQPILDWEQNLYAYELLFRNGSDDYFSGGDGYTATSKLVASSQFEHSLSDLTAGKLAHINFNLKSILKHYPTMIPAEQVVVEIVEIEKPGRRLLEECKALKAAGYKILLDNYVHQKAWLHFFPYIEMIKLDFQVASEADIRLALKIKEKFSHIKLIGSKIETQKQFQLAKNEGFDYFQGYFFAQLQPIKKKFIDANDYSLAELLFELSNREFDLAKIIDTFQSDVSLTYKLIRYSNSSLFNRKIEISSIKDAVISLGKEELIKFVTILFAAQSSGKKSSELLAMSLFRAKFSEELALMSGGAVDSSIAFLTGMFSLIDVMLDEPMQNVVEKLKLASEISIALLHKQGELAKLISISTCYEKGNWSELAEFSENLSLKLEDIVGCYRRAINWSNEQMNIIS